MGIYPDFIEIHPQHNYEMYFNALEELKLIKDAAERALGLVTEFHNNKVTCNPNQQQHIY